MLTTMEDLRKVEMSEGNILNGVDNASLRSVDSTSPVTTGVDEVGDEESKEGKEASAEAAEKKPTEGSEKEAKETTEGADESAEEGTEKKEVKTKDAIQKRIDELTRKRRTAERERDYISRKREEEVTKLKARIAELEGKLPENEKPKREDFTDEEEFHEALTDWKVEQKLRERLPAKPESEDDSKAKTENEALDSILSAGQDKYTDFNDLVLEKDLAITQEIVDAILQTDSPETATEIFYYLGKNPSEAAELSKMTPAQIARAIGRIEGIVESQPREKEEKVEKKETPPEKKETKPEKKTSQAAAPINPVRTEGLVDKDPSKMSMKEYRAWRERNK